MVNPGVCPLCPAIPWGLAIPAKVKMFLWILLKDKLLPNENLQKRNWPCGSTCVLCNMTILETTGHLFLSCNYTRRIWADILVNNHQIPTHIEAIPQLLNLARRTNNIIGQQYTVVC
jgi:zinc-binding in reverse transcriptase